MTDDLLASVVAGRRLSVVTSRERSRFTVARNEALLRLRGTDWSPHAASGAARPWTWTLPLLRMARVVSEAPSVRAVLSPGEETPVVRLVFSLPESSIADELDLSGLLFAALEPDRGTGSLVARSRRLLGRALNGALGASPRWLELRTRVGSRRFEPSPERLATARGEPLDPYVERVIAEPPTQGELEVAFALPRAGLGRALGSLFSRSDPLDELDRLWHAALLGADVAEHVRTGLSLVPRWPGPVIELGHVARSSRSDAVDGVWLVRDGVLLARLDASLATAGLDTAALRGVVDCPDLALTIDEGQVVEDDAFETLVAWLFDALAHVREDGTIAWTEDDVPLHALQTAGGATLSLEALEQHRDVLFVWRHRADAVPDRLKNRVVALWPSQHRWLVEHRERIRFVPLHALGRSPGARPADLTELVQGSFTPVRVDVPVFESSDVSWPLDVHAYVHREGGADAGLVVVLAYGRRIGFVTEPSHTIVGVSVVIELQTTEASTLRIDVLQDDVELLRKLVAHAVEQVRARADELLEAAFASVDGESAWRVPHVRWRTRQATAWTLGLRYAEHEGSLVLKWPDSPLRRLVVGRTIDGTRRTLGDAWTRARDVGGNVVTEQARRWRTLESEAEAHRPWVLTDFGRDLIVRTLGRETLWEMPIVAEAQPHVAPVASQPALRLDAGEVARLRPRAGTEPTARTLLVAHALVAKAQGHAAPEIEELALLRDYDSRAMTPGRSVSLAALREQATPPGVVPMGAVDRSLAEPVLEVPPALAALLHEVEGLRPARIGAARHSGIVLAPAAPAPVRRGGRREEPLVTVPVVDRLAAGALTLEREPASEGIALWARGLRVGNFRLPSPLRAVSGRLWLTDAGIAAGHAGLHALALEHGRALARVAVRAHLLTPPGSERRRGIEAFMLECRDAVETGRDRAGVGPMLGWTPVRHHSGKSAAALPQALGRGLPLVVRHALEQPAMIETALLSRSLVRVADPDTWPWRLRLGRRHPSIRRGIADHAHPNDVRAAACLVIAEAIRQTHGGASRLVHALQRLLEGALAGP